MKVAGAFCCSHAALMMTRSDHAPVAQRDSIYGAFRKMGSAIRALAPDAILVVGTDHQGVYPFSLVPQYCIGVGPTARGIGDGGLSKVQWPIHQELAGQVLSGVLANGVDMAYSEDMAIDHSFVTPLLLAMGGCDIPLIPIAQNCNTAPFPPLTRSYEVGLKIGKVVGAASPGRIVVIATGGLSHWIGSAEYRDFMGSPPGTRLGRQDQHKRVHPPTGRVNSAFDIEFLHRICRGDMAAFVRDWNTAGIEEQAGNGGQEVRNWVLAAGIVNDTPAAVLAYEPVQQWLTGTAVIQFNTK